MSLRIALLDASQHLSGPSRHLIRTNAQEKWESQCKEEKRLRANLPSDTFSIDSLSTYKSTNECSANDRLSNDN